MLSELIVWAPQINWTVCCCVCTHRTPKHEIIFFSCYHYYYYYDYFFIRICSSIGPIGTHWWAPSPPHSVRRSLADTAFASFTLYLFLFAWINKCIIRTRLRWFNRCACVHERVWLSFDEQLHFVCIIFSLYYKNLRLNDSCSIRTAQCCLKQ